MDNKNFCAVIVTHEDTKEFEYDGITVLTRTVEYPQIELRDNPAAERRINMRIRAQVAAFERNAAARLYREAIQEYKDAMENGYPFRPYDTMLVYTAAYNENCHLSLYRDNYTYTGGAHGTTLRLADTYSLNTGAALPLSSFFRKGTDYKKLLLRQIILQANENMKENPGIYFDDYETLIRSYFNERSFYLTPEGLVIYYGQYEIGPYAIGIQEFTIPYEEIGCRPSCRGACR